MKSLNERILAWLKENQMTGKGAKSGAGGPSPAAGESSPGQEGEQSIFVTGAHKIIEGVAGVLDAGHTMTHLQDIRVSPKADTVFEAPEVTPTTHKDAVLAAVDQWRLDLLNAINHAIVDEKLFTFEMNTKTSDEGINLLISRALHRRNSVATDEEAIQSELSGLFLAVPKLSAQDPVHDWGWTYPDAFINIPVGSLALTPSDIPQPLVYELGPKMPERGEPSPELTPSHPLLFIGDEELRNDFFKGVAEAVHRAGSIHFTDGRTRRVHMVTLDAATYGKRPELALSTLARLERVKDIGYTIIMIPDLAALEEIVESARQIDPAMAHAPDQRTIAELLHALIAQSHTNVHLMVGVDPRDHDRVLSVDDHTALTFTYTLYGPDGDTLNMAPNVIKEAAQTYKVLPHQFLFNTGTQDNPSVFPIWSARFGR